MSIFITCVNCGEKFEFTDSEQSFYKSKNFDMPKRCKSCRKSKKVEEDIEGVFKLGYKKNSFLDNANIYGIGVSVAGGTSTEYKYVIKLQLQDEVYYINFDEETKKMHRTKNIEEATAYIWSGELQDIREALEKKYPEAKVILYPISYYSHLRD